MSAPPGPTVPVNFNGERAGKARAQR
jgi:hypothetical protein